MNETTWIKEMLQYAPAWLIAAYFGYKILVRAIDVWKMKKLEKQGIKLNGDRKYKQSDLRILSEAVAETNKELKAMTVYFTKRQDDIKDQTEICLNGIKNEIHDQIDEQTKTLAEKHDTGNNLLSRMLGKLDTMVVFMSK